LRFQTKIYPISHLQLGPQTKDSEYATVYQNLPNFHSIENGSDEAFSTGKMGEEGFDYDQVKETLQIAYQYPNQGVMTELEEEIYEMEFDAERNSKISVNRGYTPYSIDWSKLSGWKEKQIPHVPRFELHHSFDIVKKVGETIPPIDLRELSKKTTDSGFQTGGWFIFRKKERWSYRSNEFSNQGYEDSLAMLRKQAHQLREIVAEVLPNRDITSGCSMEKVHAIWKI
jgi:hypothetical protein